MKPPVYDVPQDSFFYSSDKAQYSGHELYVLDRNFYKGTEGDGVNVLLAAAAFNFKRAM